MISKIEPLWLESNILQGLLADLAENKPADMGEAFLRTQLAVNEFLVTLGTILNPSYAVDTWVNYTQNLDYGAMAYMSVHVALQRRDGQQTVLGFAPKFTSLVFLFDKEANTLYPVKNA